MSTTARQTKFTTFPVVAAALLVFGAIQYVVLEAVTAAAWHHPAYSYAVNFISDLGNPVPHDTFNGVLVNSPLNVLMDVAFITQGVLFIATAIMLWRRIPGRIRGLVLALALAHGVGIILVGIFHENSTVPLALILPHFIGAFAAILCANLVAIVVGLIGRRLSAPGWYRVTSIALGVIGIGAFAWLQLDHQIYVTAGGIPERIAVYTIVAWEATTGIALLVARVRHPLTPNRPEQSSSL